MKIACKKKMMFLWKLLIFHSYVKLPKEHNEDEHIKFHHLPVFEPIPDFSPPELASPGNHGSLFFSLKKPKSRGWSHFFSLFFLIPLKRHQFGIFLAWPFQIAYRFIGGRRRRQRTAADGGGRRHWDGGRAGRGAGTLGTQGGARFLRTGRFSWRYMAVAKVGVNHPHLVS